MIPDTLRQQIDQWLDGDLPEGERTRLKESLEQTPEALEFLSDRALLHTMLAKSAAFDSLTLNAALDYSEVDHSSKKPLVQPYRLLAQPWIWASSATVACLLLISMLLL